VLLFAALRAGDAVAQESPTRRLCARCDALVAERELPAKEESAPHVVYARCAQPFFTCWTFPTNPTASQQIGVAIDEIAAKLAAELLLAAQEEALAAKAAVIGADHVAKAAARLVPCSIEPDGDVVYYPEHPPAARLRAYSADLDAYDRSLKAVVALRTAAAGEELAAALSLDLDEAAVGAAADALAREGLLLHRLAGTIARKQYAPSVCAGNFRAAADLLKQKRAPPSADPRSDPAASVVEAPAPFFDDLKERSGITWRHRSAKWYDRFLREKSHQPIEADGGVTAEDLDDDGWPDLLFVGGGGISFWRNRGDGTFEDRTAGSGLAVPGEGRMALVVDLDNDGRREIFVTYARDPVRLFRRRDDGTWEDVSAASGLQRPGDIAQPAVAFDADRDGLLDLYVGNNGDWWNGVSPASANASRNGQRNRLFRNVGGLRFEELPDSCGARDPGWCLAVGSADADGDGDFDLFLANDFGPDELLLNRGDLTFESAGRRTRFDDDGHGMNVAFADLNGDDLPDVYVSNIFTIDSGAKLAREWNRLFLSCGRGGSLSYKRSQDDLFRTQDTGWAWGALFFDADLDGDDDLYCVNGLTGYVIYPYTREVPGRPGTSYPTVYDREPHAFWLNESGRLVDASRASGALLADVNSRGLALLDFDLDGDLDLAVSNYHERPRVLRNDVANRGGRHWLSVRLVGDPAKRSSRDAIGARLLATVAGGLRVWRVVTAGEGFLSSSTLDVELGLGEAERADLEIRWPGGGVQRCAGVAADQFVTITQGVEQPAKRTRPPAPK
jgi:hypothetical protein